MICQKCGSQIGDNERFCGYCGAPVDLTYQPVYQDANQNANQNVYQNPNQNVYQNPNQNVYQDANQNAYQNANQNVYQDVNQSVYQGANQNAAYAAQQNKSNKSLKTVLIIAIAAAVVVIGAIVLAVSLSLGSRQSPEDVAKRFFVSMAEQDYNTMCECFALDLDGAVNFMVKNSSYIKESLEETYGTSNIREIYNMPENRNKAKKHYASLYGDDYQISCEVISMTTLTEREREDFLNDFKTEFFSSSNDTESLAELSAIYKNSNLDNAEEMCEIEMKTIIEGSLDKSSSTYSVYCVKINGNWKAISSQLPSITSGLY